MRLWQLLVMVVFVAVGVTLAREPVGRVMVIVFIFGLAEVFFGTLVVKSLFQTIAAIGRAESLAAYAGAVLSTAAVVVAGSITLAGILYFGGVLIRASVG
jgi:hypothetical protein